MDISGNNLKKTVYTQKTVKITYYFLIAAFILAFVTSFVVKPQQRLILWLECVITGFAAYIYSNYMNAINTYNSTHTQTLGWAGIDRLRYVDWTITTPLMLVSLSLFLSLKTNQKIHIKEIFVIVVLDWIMLYFGNLGEQRIINRQLADILGFIPLVIIFWLLYSRYIKGRNNLFNNVLYIVYLIIWFSYGVAYMYNEGTMNTIFNVLDCIAKAFVSIGISFYLLNNKKI
jgi:bacteriorhodopsin